MKLFIEKIVQYKKQLLLFAGCFLLLGICSLFWYKNIDEKIIAMIAGSNKMGINEIATSTIPTEPLYPRKLDGVGVKAGETDNQIAAVMIDNHSLAQPQSGLSRARIVYEAEAEGGITRFLAIYDTGEDVEEIGPVRSSRAYYLDWSEEYKALYVHCGGSPEALAKIEKDNIKNLNEFYNGKYFWRDENREAPHNVMISTKNIKDAIKNKEISKAEYGIWAYNENAVKPNGTSTVNEITLAYNYSFTVAWNYDIIKNNYTRFYNGNVHKDKTGEEIKADNVIVQMVDSEVVDEKLRQQLADIGNGKAYVCMAGNCDEVKWIKTGSKSRTYFFNENNEKVKLNPGITWVEIINSKNKINFK